MLAEAEKFCCEADNDDRVRRGMLAKATPQRGPYPGGSQVFFYLRRGQLKGDHSEFWRGPATVLCGRRNHIWLDHAGQCVKVSPELLRFATRDGPEVKH